MSESIASSEPLAEVPRGKLATMFAAFTYRDFRLLWFGSFTSSAGTWLQEAALNWILIALTNKTRYLGLNGFLSTAPILFLTLIGGVVADRIDRKRILMASQWTQLLCALTLALLAFAKVPPMVLVYSALALAVVVGCAQAFGGPAYQSLVPMLIDDKKDLPNAISLNSIQFHLARFVGPLIGTLPFAFFSDQFFATGVSFTFNALSFLAVILALMALKVRHIPPAPSGNMQSALHEGLSFVWHQEGLRSLTLLAFSCTFFGAQMSVFFAAFAHDVFHTGPKGNATMIAISGAGAVVGALLMAGLGNLPNKGRRALMMQLAFGLTITAFSFSTNLWMAYAMIFLSGVFMMCVFASIASLVQLLVNNDIRGRVMSIYMLAFRGGMPLGALVTGFLAERLPLMSILRVQGLMVTLLALVFLLSRSSVKNQ
jgi:predicted MFS family arabinose efflux permease